MNGWGITQGWESSMMAGKSFGSPRWGVGLQAGGAKDHVPGCGHKLHGDRYICFVHR